MKEKVILMLERLKELKRTEEDLVNELIAVKKYEEGKLNAVFELKKIEKQRITELLSELSKNELIKTGKEEILENIIFEAIEHLKASGDFDSYAYVCLNKINEKEL